ncbi:hypothetical protein C4561_01295 [candidate division WWE3 bacterium]|jgi:hypothetical protein|uniref:Glycosyltransferase RgtA/B/C/D-like domain-containing protein n=1 Tax=candidate division WWE3 bacterium TaxID=2053526 RepID=A0A3A4ZFK3_UNCKA|nr:MAG: hypothetical protein C4561_01295 [candidate division WWE3 bacterium]
MIKLFRTIKKNHVEIILLILTLFLSHKITFGVDRDSDFYYKKEDIYYEYEVAKQIQKGENPYLRILKGDMLENDKYATQLPHYYNLLAFIRDNSNDNFSGFIESFRLILYVSQVIGGVFIYLIFRKQNKRLLGLCGAIFYIFNVWTLNSMIYLKQDVLAIALLVASFYFLSSDKYRTISYVLYGLSLGIKYIGVFAFPIFIVVYLNKKLTLKKLIINFLLLFFVLITPVIPYLLEDFNSFARSLLFSLTRSPSDSEIIYGYNDLLVRSPESHTSTEIFDKLLPRIPLFISLLMTVALLFLRKIKQGTYVFLSLLVFSIFNPVIFPQYITWVPPFALFPLLDGD